MAPLKFFKKMVLSLLQTRGICAVKIETYRGTYGWLAKEDIHTVIDIGAFKGVFSSSLMRVLDPDTEYILFEPLPDQFAELKKTFAGYDNVTIHNVALADHAGDVSFHRSSFPYSSSLLPMEQSHKTLFPGSEGSQLEKVKANTLDDCLSGRQLRPNVLMKIDVQGAEKLVLEGAHKTLEQVRVLVIEMSFIELYAGQPLFHEMHDYLESRGLRFSGVLERVVSPQDGRIAQIDACYIRS